VAAAIANAIHNATGVQLTEMPVTAERLWQALAAARTPVAAD
jgi:CO/xanthine dehydrogenase Mo-binding subunit